MPTAFGSSMRDGVAYLRLALRGQTREFTRTRASRT